MRGATEPVLSAPVSRAPGSRGPVSRGPVFGGPVFGGPVFRKSLLWLLLPLALFVLAAVLAARSGRSEQVTLRLAHALNTQHPVHLGMQSFAKRLEELSKGQLKVELYADGQLGSERELLELLQIGSIAMTKVSAGQLEAFAPEFGVFSLPYLFDDSAHFWRFAETPAAQQLLRASERYRLLGLTFYDAGARSFYLGKRQTKTIQHPDDLQGLALRVMPSQTAMAVVEALGAKPVPIPFGELYSALDTGTVDGAENNIPSLYTSRQYEVASSLTLNQHTTLPDVLVIGTATWNRLSRQQQAWVQQAALDSMQVQRTLWREAEAKDLAAMRSAGFKIIDSVDREAFRARTEGIYQRPEFQTGPVQSLLEAVRAVASRHRPRPASQTGEVK